ncbi:hypothetical protein OV079_48240 [Nannocystis pusilla]|uniref:Uncharacterized protein n=1 Tax=Nannocystis pusilla TaxID=889268 RepID=A0A9X3J2Z7_9BACT|nr:hypothetical protein [Nannocystis pusilla]MCY1013196.1 hypothetical protein [Nannocystis pusilla]
MLFFNCIQNALFIAVTAFAAPDVAAPDEFAAPNDEFVEPEDENTDDDAERRMRYCSASGDYGRQRPGSGTPRATRPCACGKSSEGAPAAAIAGRWGGRSGARRSSTWISASNEP